MEGLKNYLKSNGLPMTLTEDGTRLTEQAQYDPKTNTLTGCVAPLNNDGLPVGNYFDATDAATDYSYEIPVKTFVPNIFPRYTAFVE